jgi:hypothetical protein
MGPLDLANHLANFFLPALAVAALLVAMSRFSKRKMAGTLSWWAQLAIVFVAGAVVMAGGMLLLGPDGKMATYAALVVACATVQWLLLGSWRK